MRKLLNQRACFIIFLIVFLVVASTAWTEAAIYKWLQPYDLENGYDIESYYAEDSGALHIVADDWLCTNNLPVTDIHWWGSYWENIGGNWVPYAGEEDPYRALGTSPQFLLRIYTDVPVSGNNPYSHPGDMIWEHPTSFPGGFVGHEQNPIMENASKFEWNWNLREEWYFNQDPGENVYWLSIFQILRPNDQYLWGWETSSEHWNDIATYWDGDEWYPVAEELTDMAFGLTTPIPTPGVMPLLGSVLFGLYGFNAVFRKKKQ
ncbi:MAG: hypothetical protein KAJ66_04465 [Candidatus Omnitrophica bacterium]|nr:hypothetical protein [Candidatus Omnitrophota bacterium]